MDEMNEVTYHMVAAGSRMASDLITAQVSYRMGGIGGAPEWREWSAAKVQNRDPCRAVRGGPNPSGGGHLLRNGEGPRGPIRSSNHARLPENTPRVRPTKTTGWEDPQHAEEYVNVLLVCRNRHGVVLA